VKEEIITRLSELGVEIVAGCVAFEIERVPTAEFTTGATAFDFVDVQGTAQTIALEAGMVGFTFCGVPVVYRQGKGIVRIALHQAKGNAVEVAGARLEAEASAAIFGRTGRITRIDVMR
jgi:hypothetical protein